MSKARPKTQPTDEKDLSRRKFLSLATAGILAAGAGISALVGLVFIRPRVSTGAPSKFSAGKPGTYSSGSYVVFTDQRVIVRRNGDDFAAVSTVCTHLGCTVNYTGTGFKCPCHGSQYDNDGVVTGGPAPSALSWFNLSLAPNGELEVDKNKVIDAETYLEVKS